MSLSTQERLAYRKNEFKKGINAEDARRKRDDDSTQIRKQKRRDKLAKRRLSAPSSLINAKVSSDLDKEKLQMLYSQDPNVVLNALIYLRKFVSQSKNVSTVANSGVIPKVVEFLTYDDYLEHQKEAAWIILNAISGNSNDACKILNNTPVIPHVITLLNCQDRNLRDLIVWCVGNIAGESIDYRDILLSCGVLHSILRGIESEWYYEKRDWDKLSNHVWALSNLISEKQQPHLKILYQCMPIIAKLLHNAREEEVLTYAALSLYYISDSLGDEDMEEFLQFNALTSDTIRLLNTVVAPQILKVCGNLIAGNDDNITQRVIDMGFLDYVPMLLSRSTKIRKETCWILSNIAAGTKSQARSLIKTSIIPMVISHLSNDKFSVKYECVYVLYNMSYKHCNTIIDYLVLCGSIKALADFIGPKTSERMINMILGTFKKFLKTGQKSGNIEHYRNLIEEADGLDKIESLQYHQNGDIYKNAVELLDKYFNEYEEDTVINNRSFDITETPLQQQKVFEF